MRITFQGATRQVTGSAHLLEIGAYRILLDCGLFDSNRLDPESPNRHMPFDPRSLNAVIVSHAHNDHIGRLPCLIRQGYNGPVYCTNATADIMGVMLRDSARIQREDASGGGYGRRGHNPRDRGIVLDHAPASEPLFDLFDVEQLIDSITRVSYTQPLEILRGVWLTCHDAGHILGSSIIQLDFWENGRDRRLVFTGDLGRRGMGLLPNPTGVQNIDILITESTYGHKSLDSYDTLLKQLHAIILRAHRLQSKIVIPAFSLGRTQRMAYCLQELFQTYKVRPLPVFVDSPLGSRLTEIHRDYPEAYTPQARKLMDADPTYFGSKYVEYCVALEDSRKLNFMNGPMAIIASSGMCEAGRIRHHLKQTISNPDNAVVIVSYQAEGTLGRQLADGAERVQIMDQGYDLNAAVYVLDGFSGHADKNDLAWWFEQTGGGIEHAFVVHGEMEAMDAISPVLQQYAKNPVQMPEYMQTYEV